MSDFNVYTQSDFARRIGKSKQCICNAIRRHRARVGSNDTLEFESVTGERIRVKLLKAEGSKKWLISIVAIYVLVQKDKAIAG
jgi:hypothetical protein